MSNNESGQPYSKNALAAAVSAACAGVPIANAQDVAIEEIIVTATKRAESIQDVAMSITAFSDDEIVRQGFKKLGDYVGRIPALSWGVREPGGSSVIMRGCAVSGIAFSDNPTTAVYLDEQPITVAGFNPDPRLVDIQRVEALSGPQGSLFGDASQCGTLRIITAKPDASEFEGWVDLSLSSVSRGEVGYDVSAMLNVPIIEDKLALRLVGFQAEEAGYIDNVLGNSPGGPAFGGQTFDNADVVEEDVNSATVSGGRASLRWHPTDEWTVDAGAIFQKLEQNGFNDTDLAENFLDGRSLGEWEQMRWEDDQFDDEWYQLALTLEGSLGWADVTVAGSFMNREFRFDADATTYLSGWQERYPNKLNDGAYYAIYDFPDQDPRAKVFSLGDTDRTSLEIRLATPADSDSRWSGIVGLFYNEVENHAFFASNVKNLPDSGLDYYAALCGAHCYLNYTAFYYNCGTMTGNDCINPVTPSANWWNGVYDNSLTQTALFGEASFDLTDNFSITVGGRWFDIETDRRLVQATLVGGLTDYRTLPQEANCAAGDLCYQDAPAASNETGFVPKITGSFRIDDNKMVYATYSEGFRRGGGNAARQRSIFGRAPFNEFQSDLVKNYEIGAKTSWLGGRMQFNVTLYSMIWENIQIEAEDPTPNLFTLGILNFPEASIDGLEIFWRFVPSEKWDINASLGINNAELSQTASLQVAGAPVDRTAVKGTRLPLTPENKFSLSVDYYPGGSLMGAEPYFGIGIDRTGDSVNSLSGIQSIEFNTPTRLQAGYTLVDLRFGLNSDDWSAMVSVDNVGNTYAEQFYNDRWAQTRLSVNRPRTISVNFRKHFR